MASLFVLAVSSSGSTLSKTGLVPATKQGRNENGHMLKGNQRRGCLFLTKVLALVLCLFLLCLSPSLCMMFLVNAFFSHHLGLLFLFYLPNALNKYRRPEIQTTCSPWTTQSMEFSRPEYWSGKPFPSPGIFPTQGSNPGRQHCRHVLYHLSHQGSPDLKR